ncbi:hypothetical protein ABZW10_10005 [Kitasatospora sp. NPDC004723]|uniref:hypothetical protein n=1 Tax=Kitasatospora sp. NPDC004723 TaxID=3154288 RepID=UPI0033AA3DC6
MSRTRARLAATGTAVVLAVTGMSGVAVADTDPASTPSTGSAVVNSSTTFLKDQALNGIVVIPLPSATPSYDSTTGINTTFQVTGGSADLLNFYGDIELGGGLLFVNVFTGKSVTFNQLHFNVNAWSLTGVPVGSTDAVKLLDPRGRIQLGGNSANSTLASSDLQLDAAGATYLDSKLKTDFFKGGQSVGSFSLKFTQGS